MTLLYIILIAILIGWWISTSDIAYSLSGLIVTRAVKKYMMTGSVLFFILLGGILFSGKLSLNIEEKALLTTPVSSAVIAVSASIAVLATYKISKFSSVCYGVMGAIFGWKLFMYNSIDEIYLIKLIFLWILAPVLALALSAFLSKLYKNYIRHSHIHFIKLSYYLRIGIIINIFLFATAIGINNGSVLIALNSTVKTNFNFAFENFSIHTGHLLFLVSTISIFLTTYWKAIRTTNNLAQNSSDFGTESALLTVFSSNIVLFSFSFPVCSYFTGLEAGPLSVSQIIFGSIIGNNLTNRKSEINSNQFSRLFISILLTPATAFLIAYFIFNSINRQSVFLKEPPFANITHSINIINVAVPILIIISILLIAGILFYFRKQNKIKIRAQREALKHQENLFENQKSLSALEVKAVLLENDSLNSKLELKRQELTNIALNISEQKAFLENVYNELKNIKEITQQEHKDKKIEELERQILQKMNFSQEIESFYTQIEKLHKDFNLRLTEQHPKLTENEKRLITLLRLGFSTKHIASLMNISPKSVEIARYRLRNKLKLPHEQKLINYLKSI